MNETWVKLRASEIGAFTEHIHSVDPNIKFTSEDIRYTHTPIVQIKKTQFWGSQRPYQGKIDGLRDVKEAIYVKLEWQGRRVEATFVCCLQCWWHQSAGVSPTHPLTHLQTGLVVIRTVFSLLLIYVCILTVGATVPAMSVSARWKWIAMPFPTLLRTEEAFRMNREMSSKSPVQLLHLSFIDWWRYVFHSVFRRKGTTSSPQTVAWNKPNPLDDHHSHPLSEVRSSSSSSSNQSDHDVTHTGSSPLAVPGRRSVSWHSWNSVVLKLCSASPSSGQKSITGVTWWGRKCGLELKFYESDSHGSKKCKNFTSHWTHQVLADVLAWSIWPKSTFATFTLPTEMFQKFCLYMT